MKANNNTSSSLEKDIMKMIQELCDIAGYGIRSGINVGEKGECSS